MMAGRGFLLAVSIAVFLTAACGSSGSSSNVEGVPEDFSHLVAPTDEMVSIARAQCENDPSLDEGVVELVDPNTDQAISRAVVDC